MWQRKRSSVGTEEATGLVAESVDLTFGVCKAKETKVSDQQSKGAGVRIARDAPQVRPAVLTLVCDGCWLVLLGPSESKPKRALKAALAPPPPFGGAMAGARCCC